MIVLEGLNLKLPGFALRNLNLHVERGEFFALIGPTGAGKTLVLEAVAGLVGLNSGRILLEGRDITRLPPERRGIGIVYQDYALFPHLSVLENIKFGLRYRPANSGQAKKIDFLAESLGLTRLLNRSVDNLSGGERQRTALARALVVEPSVLLLDEPLAALDPNFREELRLMLKQIHEDTGITILMVTHDFTEVLFLADRAAVIDKGVLQQTGEVAEIFQRPVSEFVARFVGMKNILPVEMDGETVRAAGLNILLSGDYSRECSRLAIRPEDIAVSTTPQVNNGLNVFQGHLDKVVNLGPVCEVHVACAGATLQAMVSKSALFESGLRPGAEVHLSFRPEAVHLF